MVRAFEANVRKSVRAAIDANPLLDDARSAANGVKATKESPEQVDLVVQIGDLLVVGEVKCFLFPADSRERFRHRRKLKEAADQAWRKAQRLSSRPDVAARAPGISQAQAASLRPIRPVDDE